MARIFFSTKKLSLSIGLITIIVSLLLMAPGAAMAQTAVTPPGAGTSASPYLISQIGHLVWMSDNAAGSSDQYYTMTGDIDASATTTWNDAGTDTSLLEGFKPIGTYSDPDTTCFRGIFDGGGHTITGLVINRPATYSVGLFGHVGSGGEVRNLGLIGGAVTGSSYVGGLVGWNSGTVSNSYATGAVTGTGNYVGGLVGVNSGTVSNSYATGAVTGSSNVGGLVGYNSGTVSDSYATGAVTGSSNVGGLVGVNYYSTVSSSYWDTQTSGLGYSHGGGIGKTTAQMKQQVTFVGWDFTTVWIINENVTYPRLRAKVSMPVFTPDGDFYRAAQNVVITCTTPGATIHYTTNGNDPTESDSTIASGANITVNLPTTLKAKAWKTDFGPSGVKEAIYLYGIVVNPSMEGDFVGGIAKYWTGWDDSYYATFGESTNPYYAHEGNKSQQISWYGIGYGNFGPAGIYQQLTDVQVGKIYRLSAWNKFRFEAMGAMMSGAQINYSIGVDPNGGTNPDAVTNWISVYDSGGGWYEGDWISLTTCFSPTAATVTVFIKADGYGQAETEDPGQEPPMPMPVPWNIDYWIDDVSVVLIEVGNNSIVEATTPVPADGNTCSEVTLTILDPNGTPLEGIPASEITINCTGSGNTIFNPTNPTYANGKTTAYIKSTVAETKTVSATVLGTTLSNTATIEFIGYLQVDPQEVFSTSGTTGGPFSPESKTYTLTNVGPAPIQYSVAKSNPTDNWFDINGTNQASGLLGPHGTVMVTLSLNDNAKSLGSGQHSGSVIFTNTTTGFGNTTRNINLGIDMITIGTGSDSWYMPLYTGYDDSRIQVIYLASEIGASKILTGLGLDVTQLPGQTLNNWTIRMKHTSMTDYSSNANWQDGWTVVYQNNKTISSTGWVEFQFDTPFNYNGSDNLLVDFSHNNSSYAYGGYCRYSSPGGFRSISYLTDSGYGDPLLWVGGSPYASKSDYVPNIRLFFEYPSIPGDANGDNKVDVSDLGILAANYGTTFGATLAMGDFNNDGVVDVSDLGILAANYGTGTGGTLDFNADAKSMGLTVDKAREESVSIGSACPMAGLPLIAVILLAGLLVSRFKD